LQELIAPPRLVFLSNDWEELGSRTELVDTISAITGIDRFLFQHGMLGRYSIAQRMSWASKRETTRVEDKAYCLLGLFSVNMPLLYGEGRRAFIRLQEEIMRQSDDHSIFAWSSDSINETGMLASSPADFLNSGKIIKIDQDRSHPPYSITNKGIQITLPIIDPGSNYSLPFIPSKGINQHGVQGVQFAFTPTATLAILSCQSSISDDSRIAIFLERTSALQPYHRSDHSLGLLSLPTTDIDRNSTVDTVLIRASAPRDERPLWPDAEAEKLIIIKELPSPQHGFQHEIHTTSG
jgi:hypothetical protein